MTRGATNGLLPDDVDASLTKRPQPVLDPLPSGLSEDSGNPYSKGTRPSVAPRASTRADVEEDGSDSDDGLHMGNGGAARSKPVLSRARSELGPRDLQRVNGNTSQDGGEEQMRHGWEEQLTSPEQATLLSQTFYLYYNDKRHETAGNPRPVPAHDQLSEWRMRDRLKTVSAILAVCLNIGVDPPDVIKTNPCARMECWTDPANESTTSSSNSNSGINAQISKNLQTQYENLSMRTRYKPVVDPTIEEMKKYCLSLRKQAREERILFHYNGHGVPKPTPSGEIWVFNRTYTQYIPISLYDLQDLLQAPSLFVYDCSSAGLIIKNFQESAAKHTTLDIEIRKRDPQRPAINYGDCIHLAACRETETLPTNPDLPADIFTSCLTTPIAMAVRFFILQNPLKQGVSLADGRNIPGKVSERRTPLGELNWIFTAITDTIAWNMLPKHLFKKLFRQDLMVAALFRNFLLAQRVMRIYHCHPVSYPAIPNTHDHPLWDSWDLAIEMILTQLPHLLEQSNDTPENAPAGAAPTLAEIDYQHSEFFADQLSAFEVYLQSGAPSQKVPEQLPIVLQVLLSQVHRLRALILLSKFLDLGPWAVNLALNIGIFPYVLKLLQSQAVELKPVMVFIWARILAIDNTCQSDLIKDNGYMYFTSIIVSATGIPIGNVAEHRAMCAFVIAKFCEGFPVGRHAVLQNHPDIVESLLNHLLDMENPLLRQFSCLCLGNLWEEFEGAKLSGIQFHAHLRLCDLAQDPVPEVRAATLDALTSFLGFPEATREVVSIEETVASIIMAMTYDGSIMVRRELTVFYSKFVGIYEKRFVIACWEQLIEERNQALGMESPSASTRAGLSGETLVNGSHVKMNGVNGAHSRDASFTLSDSSGSLPRTPGSLAKRPVSKGTVYAAIWKQVLMLSTDPHPEVAQNAATVVDYILNALLVSPLGVRANQALDDIIHHAHRPYQQGSKLASGPSVAMVSMSELSRVPSIERPRTPPSPTTSMQSRGDGYFAGLRKTAMSASMKNLSTFFNGPKTPDGPPSPSRESIRSQATTMRSKPVSGPPTETQELPPDAMDNVVGPPHQPPAKVPTSPGFKQRDLSSPPSLPLKSNFLDWSATYFREPQMRPSEADEPGSKNYNERLWRRNRNDRIISDTQPQKEEAGSTRWDTPSGYFGIGAAPTKMLFHQFEDHLITADDFDSIAVWDWRKKTQLARFSNGNPVGSRVTQLRFLNEDDQAMLMTASSNGVLKIFRNYEDIKEVELAASFRALTDLVQGNDAGLVFDWQQGQGRVLVAGDDRVIRVWQAGHELCILDIPTRTRSSITCLTSDQVEGNVFVAGFANGAVRVYDQRHPPRETMTQHWTDHKSWIVGVHLQRGGMRELLSAEANGGVRLWDIRMTKSVAGFDGDKKTAKTANLGSLRTLSVHEHAPVFATGSADHTIRVYNTSTLKQLSSCEPYMSFLRTNPMAAPRHAPITATAFHPHRMMLACGAVNDGHVNIFGADLIEVKKRSVVEEWVK